ncbi:hypothetical protein VKS41_005180 [Umbelopsis sp. WA50703]
MSSRFTEHFDIVHPNAQTMIKSYRPSTPSAASSVRATQQRSNTFSSSSSERSTSSGEFSDDDKKKSLVKRFMTISRRK